MFRSFRSLMSLGRCAALACLALPGVGHAFSACVGTAQGLHDALTQLNASADATTTIMIREGTYLASPGTAFYLDLAHSNQTVTLSGGWSGPNNTCQTRRYGANSGTVLVGTNSISAFFVDAGIGQTGNTVTASDLALRNPTPIIGTTTAACLNVSLNSSATVRVYRALLEQCVGESAARLQNFGGDLTLGNLVVIGNYTANAPLVVETQSGGVTRLAHLTITGNQATSSSQNASGLFLYTAPNPASQVLLTNSVIWGGIAPVGIPDIHTSGPGITFTRTHYDTRTNLNAAIVDNSPSMGDPGFLSPTNPRLRRNSILVDSGLATGVGGTADADGNPRMQGLAADVGAYEALPDRLFSDGFNQ